MIRVVVDTGVVVSAAFRDRTPEQVILFIVENQDFEWVVSPAILEEYNDVLAREKFALPPEILETWRVVFDESTTRVEADIEINFPRDQTDAKFIACALSAEADYLITGDRDLEEARKLVQTTIISVSQFARLIIENWIDRPDHS